LKLATQQRVLAEFDCNIAPTVRSDRPRGRYISIRTEDVRAVLCAVHEHRVELRVVDPSRPPADVFADLRAQMTAKVLLHAAVVLESHVGRSKVCSLGAGNVVEAAAPGQWRQPAAGAVLVDE